MSFEELPVQCGVVYEGERIRRGDMQVELGGPKVEQKFEIVYVRPLDQVEDGKITIEGPDLPQMEEGSRVPLGILIEVAGKEVEEDLEGVIERHIHEYCNFVEGIMHLNQRYDIWIRLSKKSFKKGFNSLKHLGTVLMHLFKTELPIIEKIQVTFYTDPDKIAEHYNAAVQRYEARDARTRGLKDEEVPLTARVQQVVDVYDALTTERPYKAAMSPIQAFETINEEVVKGWWDPEVVAAFQGLVLNNGSRHGHV